MVSLAIKLHALTFLLDLQTLTATNCSHNGAGDADILMWVLMMRVSQAIERFPEVNRFKTDADGTDPAISNVLA